MTVAQFRAYVEDAGVVTSAEKLGFGMVAVEGMADWEWKKTPGATWRSPFPDAGLPLDDNWPVVMVSWLDAARYCQHFGLRLPTEAEWEYAMRAGTHTRFPWGETPVRPDGGYGLNFWQGKHQRNERGDGFVYLSPVRAFPPNAWGLYDATGNVWQWVADWYDPMTYENDKSGVKNPQGPDAGRYKAARGGSWWCSKHTCSGYGLFARGKTQPDAPYNNNGFRCVKDGKK